MNTSAAIIPGSLGAISKQNGQSLAETFVNADCIVIVDTSGSMACEDSRSEKSRYVVALEELAALQNSLPGKIGVISFSDSAVFCPSGQPVFGGGGTDLAGALRFAKLADVPNMRFIVISDGEPNQPEQALAEAKTYKNRIDVIYVGPEANPHGRNFLKRLAKVKDGELVTADRANNLLEAAQKLLLHA